MIIKKIIFKIIKLNKLNKNHNQAVGSPGIFGIKIPGLTKRIKEVSADNKTGANIFNIYLMIKLVNYN